MVSLDAVRAVLLTSRHREEQLGAGELMHDKVYSHGIWAMVRAGGDSMEFDLRDEKTTESLLPLTLPSRCLRTGKQEL